MSLNLDVAFYFRYVDDICTAVAPSKIDLVLEQFNSFHPRLQFTSEFEGDEISFLDVTISIIGNKFGFDWYRKPTFSGRFLNFYSNHPIAQKRGTIFSLIDRTFLLSDVRFHTQNLTFIINILLDNDYPLSFIFDTINLRIKNLIKNRHITQSGLTD